MASHARIPVQKVVPHPSATMARTRDEFWPRMGRAITLLLSAVALHVFVVQAPRPALVASASSTGAVSSALAHGSNPAPLSTGGIARTAATAVNELKRGLASTADHVKVVTSAIRAFEIREQDGRARPRRVPPPEAMRADARPRLARIERHAITEAAAHPRQLAYSSASADASAAAGAPAVPLTLDVPQPEHPEPAASTASSQPAVPAPAKATFAAGNATGAAGPSSDTRLREQEQDVRRILAEYRRAYERLDVQATKAIYPSVDDRELQRRFDQLKSQQLRMGCDVRIVQSGEGANARCRGDATFHPKVGSRRLRYTELEWTFSLSRNESGWQILNATTQ
jgi:hypothetical protein